MNKYIAGYERLSQDDDSTGESNSIISQRQIIKEYISSNAELSDMPYIEFVDDGYSGTSFDRPGIKQLLERVRKGEIACIVVKDLSRFGRQYLEVSKFVEQIFPYLGVRFIAVNDHYDSNSHKGTTAEIDVPIRNMINAMYSKDISKKIKSAKQTKIQQGVFMNAQAIYGYVKDSADKNRLLIDETAAAVVRQIFGLALDGVTSFQIAEKLNRANILPPSAHKKQNGSNRGWNTVNEENIIWTKAAVLRVLRDERYTGTFVGGKWNAGKLGSKKHTRKSSNEWVRVPNTHQAIITQELFDNVSEKISGKARSKSQGNTNRPLYKKVWCGCCGHRLRYRGDTGFPFFYCDTARYSKQHSCSCDKTRETELIEVVTAVLFTQLKVLLDYEKFCRMEKRRLQKTESTASTSALRLGDEIKELQLLKRKLYERYKKSEVSKADYLREREVLEVDLSKKTSELETLSAKQSQKDDMFSDEQQFLQSFLKYKKATELDKALADELIEAVYVYGNERIEIKFKFADKLAKIIEKLSNVNKM